MRSAGFLLLSASTLANSLTIHLPRAGHSIMSGMDNPSQAVVPGDSDMAPQSSRQPCSFNMAKIVGTIRPSLPMLLIFVGILILIMHVVMLRTGCFASRVKALRERLALRRQARRERRLKKALHRVARRLARRSARKERVSRFKCLLARLAFWRRRSPAQQQDEEKVAFLHSDRQQSHCMADEITQFRAAVSVVDDMVADQESKSRLSDRPKPATSSAFVEHVLDDEDLLPAYEATQPASRGSSVSGGIVYTPSASSYTVSAADDDEVRDEKH